MTAGTEFMVPARHSSLPLTEFPGAEQGRHIHPTHSPYDSEKNCKFLQGPRGNVDGVNYLCVQWLMTVRGRMGTTSQHQLTLYLS